MKHPADDREIFAGTARFPPTLKLNGRRTSDIFLCTASNTNQCMMLKLVAVQSLVLGAISFS